MFKLFRVFGLGKDDIKEKKSYTEGDKSKGLCPNCSTVVETTWLNKQFEFAGVEKKVLVSICDVCETIIGSEDKEMTQAIKDIDTRQSQETFSSVRGSIKTSIEDIGEAEVVIDNDIEAKNAFLNAFDEDVLQGVGKGDVSIINSGDSHQESISSLLGEPGESFHNILRKKEKIGCKLWVNWLKHDNGEAIPCNEIISLAGDWSIDAANETTIHELEEKLVLLSGTDKVAILMVQKIKNKK